MKIFYAYVVLVMLVSCHSSTNNIVYHKYSSDLALLALNTNYVELEASSYPGKICICPTYQGRVMTSTSNFHEDISNGWLNREILASNYHGNGGDAGGEDRVWIGPLGGQYSFYYGQQKPLSEDNWKVPACMNEEAFEVMDQSEKSIHLSKEMSLTNFIGTKLHFLVQRNINILEKKDIENDLDIDASDLDVVAYSSEHTLTNLDSVKWDKSTGLATIWSMGMFEGSDKSTVIIPVSDSIVLDDINTYMGHLNSSKIQLINNALIYKTDGKYRSKIGIPSDISPAIFGNYKPETNTLTIIQYQHNGDSLYFNSEVSIQDNPYNGEAIQVYNNGSMDYSPAEDASFFELESSAPFKELDSHEKLNHYHSVYHFTGNINKLNVISRKLLGIKLTAIELKARI